MTAKLHLLPPPGGLRRFAVANLINTVGSGLYITSGTLFFTRAVGLTVEETALGMTVGTGVGLALMMVFGRLSDRFGPKPVYVSLLVAQALMMAAFTQVRSFSWFLVVAVVSGIADRGIAGTAGALIHAMSDAENRITARAQLRTSTNVGLGLGTLIAGTSLLVDTAAAYTCVVAGNAVLFGTAAAMLLGVDAGHRRAPGTAGAATARTAAPLRDRRYLAVTAANGLLALHASVLSFALPLWVAGHTEAPKWSIAMVMIVNTVLVVLLQVRVSRRTGTVPQAARMARLTGVVFAMACLTMAATRSLGPALSVGVLLLWAVIYTAGELAQTSAEFCLGFELAPDHAQGAYQSVFALGPGVMRALAPTLLATLVLGNGSTGWLALAGFFLVSGLLVSAAARSANRDRGTFRRPAETFTVPSAERSAASS
ncbi:MFS transporter [Streptomyces sulfonofaciens]|uniref:MFS transporter n=1 Tax=Streptomyces sulfonofaciens TaxID=68272 RepID=A0A919GEY9_9ACTN|nr:MFS transporter [Streptomyces sulfonofaciens]GHH82953.1 MFS transporter [Streptomyces sulfonofaciens]